ncbi:hypothetical protein XENOCAPTIV_013394 [Xenoophorus captivus]|uniref:Uncharacterized protein n=1 Tax=Xenoophorus captivus TaxID=1517983 RepID=A0ABV0RQD0_9TELE
MERIPSVRADQSIPALNNTGTAEVRPEADQNHTQESTWGLGCILGVHGCNRSRIGVFQIGTCMCQVFLRCYSSGERCVSGVDIYTLGTAAVDASASNLKDSAAY